MGARQIAAIALTGAVAAGGAGVAIAGGAKDDNKGQKGADGEAAILADAAKRLNVSPAELRDALAAAQEAALDRAVAQKRLTQEQADAIKARRKASGRVLGGGAVHGFRFRGGTGPHGGPHGGRGPKAHRPGMRRLLGDVAAAIGTTPAKLLEDLRAGKSMADIAKANGKSVEDVRAAVKAAVKTRIDEAVKDGQIERKHADAMLEHLDKALEKLDSQRPLLPRHGRMG